MMDEDTAQEFLKELELLGPDRVQRNMDRGLYGAEEAEHARLARAYLESVRSDDEELRLKEQATRESRLIAAAEDAGTAARRANRRAKRAVLLASLAVVASVLALAASLVVFWRAGG